jgi:hypothetical protein
MPRKLFQYSVFQEQDSKQGNALVNKEEGQNMWQ